eukprot:TRINITY_DN23013_c0_g1_i1.p1 TRINITY_DN23013_c0_g1~~TRINITY_DN23013_c0_g1_i1.p1  ORF type:complete len:322 (+),score=126.28 TRINITY_DN23013_c0_g1_i1:238-1203(+)
MDCSIVPLKKVKDHFMISTIDFFYPLVEDPYVQGKVGCANVLSDMYSMGIDEIDTMLMVLGASKDMEESDRFIVTKEMMKGFNDLAHEADTAVTGGQSVLNPWPIIGGVAMSVCHKDDFVSPDGLLPGDFLVLTKPLGTQIAVNLRQAFNEKKDCNPLYAKTKHLFTQAQVDSAFSTASDSMAYLNRTGAKLMRQHKSNGATDVTGFGILGHASNLAVAQKAQVHITLHTLPIISGMAAADAAFPDVFKLHEGYSAETSGGLLAALPSQAAAEAFIADLKAADGVQGWVIGHVSDRKPGSDINTAELVSPKIIEVERFFHK